MCIHIYKMRKEDHNILAKKTTEKDVFIINVNVPNKTYSELGGSWVDENRTESLEFGIYFEDRTERTC